MRDQCEARIEERLGGTRCPFAAKRRFYCDPLRIRVCQRHFDVLARTENPADLIARWRAA